MKEYPVGSAFYKAKRLVHIEGKVKFSTKKKYKDLALKKGWSLIQLVSYILEKNAPKR